MRTHRFGTYGDVFLNSYSRENTAGFLKRAVTGRLRGVSNPCDEETSAGSFRTLEFRHRWAESTEAAGGETSASATWWRSPGPETRTSSPVWQTSEHLSIKPNRREKTLSGLSLKKKSPERPRVCVSLGSQLIFLLKTASVFRLRHSKRLGNRL